MTRLLLAVLAFALLAAPSTAHARKSRVVYHASKKVHDGIQKSGRLDMSFARPGRVGKGAYFALSRRGAVREKPGAKAVWTGRINRSAWAKRLDTRKMNTQQLKKYTAGRDMRGAVKKGVMGPKLGKEVGKRAAKEGRIVVYKGRGSGKRAWSNVFVPSSVYKRKPPHSKLKLEKGR